MKRKTIGTLLLILVSASEASACYINRPMYEEIKKFDPNCSQIEFASAPDWQGTMDFYVTFRTASAGNEKKFVGLIKFNDNDCHVVSSHFEGLSPLVP